MRLTKKNLAFYLVDKGFLESKAIINGDFVLSLSQNRNSIFRIQTGKPTGLFVKQLVNMDPQNCYLMQKDATSNYLIHNYPFYKNIARHVPAYYGYDPQKQILVTEYIPNSKNIYELVAETKTLSPEIAALTGEVVASYHFDISDRIENNPSLQFFSKSLPWIFTTLESEQGFEQVNEATQFISQLILNDSFLMKHIERLKKEWKYTSLIHGDIKWVNFIVTQQDNKSTVKLIDWEIADIGDPLWDAAGVLQSYLSAWVTSYDHQKIDHQQLPGFEYLTIPNMKIAVNAFWDEYVKQRGFDDDEANEALLKTMDYTAARMLQTAFEGNIFNPALKTNSVRIAQLCSNIFENPAQSASSLLGLKTLQHA